MQRFLLQMKIVSAGILAVLVSGGISWAQAKAEPPSLPLVAPVPENVEWTVNVQYPEAASMSEGAPPMGNFQVTQVRTTKTGKLKRDEVTVRNGSTTEQWCSDTMFFWTSPDGEVVVSDLQSALPTELDDPNPTVLAGFPGVRWLKLENYKGVALLDKRPCYHFSKEGIEAWIDVETKLPTMYRSKGITYRFQFSPNTPQPLTISSAHQTALNSAQKLIDRRKQLEKDIP